MLAYSFYENDSRMLQYAKALVQRGDIVDVIALRREGQPDYEVLNGVNVFRIQSRTVDEYKARDHLVRILMFLLRAAIVLTKKHWRHPYQLIHVHSVPDFLVFAALIPRLSGTPVILDIHDILPEFYASKFKASPHSITLNILLFAERLSASFSNHVIIANHLWHKRLTSRSVPAIRCTPICNYPDMTVFSPHLRKRANGKFLITYPGTLNWHQGLDIAISAFAKIADLAPDAEFHIYGEGPVKPTLIEQASSLGLNGKVVFHDILPITEIAQVMADSDLAVVPKRASSPFGNEAASTKIAEFMCVGVPVIESRTRIGMFYENESRVRFFKSEDVDDLGNAIMELYRNPQLREQLTANAAQHVRMNNWNVKKHVYLQLVDMLVDTGQIFAPAQSGCLNPEGAPSVLRARFATHPSEFRVLCPDQDQE